MAFSILMYGRDSDLLKTRRWVLEACGYHVWTEDDLTEIPPSLAALSFDLLIICHSVPAEDCEIILELATLHWPAIKTLILRAGVSGCHTQFLSNVFEIAEGPAKLVSTVNKINNQVRLAAHVSVQ